MSELDKIDISESWLREKHPDTFDVLLIDHSSPKDFKGKGVNIIWATDSHESRGAGYAFFDHITGESITGENGDVIRPRALKAREEQIMRTKEKAEVFTPSWICNAQNNLIDEAWFGYPGAFNREFIDAEGNHCWEPSENVVFSDVEGKRWQDYVKDMRLEITCGEAPYLVSRYDAVTGAKIEDLRMRVGLLDRKLRVINENTEEVLPEDDPKEKRRKRMTWLYWARLALEAIYGYEWQGDNLLLARENILLTVNDYFKERCKKDLDKKSLSSMAYIISWNIFQMDGLKFTLPGYDGEIPPEPQKIVDAQPTLDLGFDELEEPPALRNEDPHNYPGLTFAMIRDWPEYHRLENERLKIEKKEKRKFSREEKDEFYRQATVRFRSLLNNNKN